LRWAADELDIDRDAAVETLRRTAADPSAPPSLRGAALGALRSLGALADVESASAAIRGAGRPDLLGDYIVGLFALAREELLSSDHVLPVIDALVAPMTREDS
jgi:hypothetical protein